MTLQELIEHWRAATPNFPEVAQLAVTALLDHIEEEVSTICLTDIECVAFRKEFSHYFIPYTDEGDVVSKLWARIDCYVEKRK